MSELNETAHSVDNVDMYLDVKQQEYLLSSKAEKSLFKNRNK